MGRCTFLSLKKLGTWQVSGEENDTEEWGKDVFVVKCLPQKQGLSLSSIPNKTNWGILFWCIFSYLWSKPIHAYSKGNSINFTVFTQI